MKNKPRISSILKASSLDASITGWESFHLSALNLATELDFQLPTNLRLGHLAEKVVSALIHSATNYKVLYENIQLTENNKTIGEIDFIIANKNTQQLTHVELAYKFYLFDPNISDKKINNWIGPNRNDSLSEKLDKIRNKQFPLLYHRAAQSQFDQIEINKVSQKLCLLVSLFIPYQYKADFSMAYQKAIKGYYLNRTTFNQLDHAQKTYYLPPKNEWGIDPAENETWMSFDTIKEGIAKSMAEKRALLCWQKQEDSYSAFFIVWW